MAKAKIKLDPSELINQGFSILTGLIGKLFKSKTRAIVKELDAKANYAAALDQKNKAFQAGIYVLAAVLVFLVLFFIIKRRRK